MKSGMHPVINEATNVDRPTEKYLVIERNCIRIIYISSPKITAEIVWSGGSILSSSVIIKSTKKDYMKKWYYEMLICWQWSNIVPHTLTLYQQQLSHLLLPCL